MRAKHEGVYRLSREDDSNGPESDFARKYFTSLQKVDHEKEVYIMKNIMKRLQF